MTTKDDPNYSRTFSASGDEAPVEAGLGDLSVGQVQWHSSEEDGGPDVGVLLRLSDEEYLWAGELIKEDEAGDNCCGLVIYTDKEKRLVLPCDFETARDLVEEHIAPAVRNAAALIESQSAEIARSRRIRDGLEDTVEINAKALSAANARIEKLEAALEALADSVTLREGEGR